MCLACAPDKSWLKRLCPAALTLQARPGVGEIALGNSLPVVWSLPLDRDRMLEDIIFLFRPTLKLAIAG